MASFDFTSFILGLLVGALLMLIIIWIFYFTRTFLFTYCPTQARPCGGADYYNDPGDALANNPQLTPSDILFITSNNEMFYTRVPRNTDCVPESNQIVYMQYPQYCSFSTTGGVSGTWIESAFNSNIYNPSGFVGPKVTTSGNCIPNPGYPVTTGIPIVNWNANPLPV